MDELNSLIERIERAWLEHKAMLSTSLVLLTCIALHKSGLGTFPLFVASIWAAWMADTADDYASALRARQDTTTIEGDG